MAHGSARGFWFGVAGEYPSTVPQVQTEPPSGYELRYPTKKEPASTEIDWPVMPPDSSQARKRAAVLLQESGALVSEEPHQNNIDYSERADVPIEPRLTWQWWLRYPRVEEAKSAKLVSLTIW